MPIKRIGIVVGGGPAPGTNGVIAAVGTHSHLLATVPEYRDVLSASEEEVGAR